MADVYPYDPGTLAVYTRRKSANSADYAEIPHLCNPDVSQVWPTAPAGGPVVTWPECVAELPTAQYPAGRILIGGDVQRIPIRLKARIDAVRSKTSALVAQGFTHGSLVHDFSNVRTVSRFIGLDRGKGKPSFLNEIANNGPIPVPGVDPATGDPGFFMVTNSTDAAAIYDSMEARELQLVAGETRLIKQLVEAAATGVLANVEAVQDTRT